MLPVKLIYWIKTEKKTKIICKQYKKGKCIKFNKEIDHNHEVYY